MKNLLILAMIATLGLVGCPSSPPPPEEDPAKDDKERTEEARQELGVPIWFVEIPSEPGKAFYGTGTASFRNRVTMQKALANADQGARRQLADTMKTTIQAVTKSYMRQVLTPENEIQEEALTQDVMRSVTDWAVMGAAIVKRDLYDDPEEDLTTVYSLARIGFDSVAETLHNETSKAIQKVQQHAEDAFNEMDDILAAEQAKNAPPQPAPAGLPPVERVEPTAPPQGN